MVGTVGNGNIVEIAEICLDQNLRELNVNTISRFTTWVNCELQERQFVSIFRDFGWKISKSFAWFHIKLLELRKFGVNMISQSRTDVKRDFHEMLKIACKHEFSVN